jgi:hypothetical protein
MDEHSFVLERIVSPGTRGIERVLTIHSRKRAISWEWAPSQRVQHPIADIVSLSFDVRGDPLCISITVGGLSDVFFRCHSVSQKKAVQACMEAILENQSAKRVESLVSGYTLEAANFLGDLLGRVPEHDTTRMRSYVLESLWGDNDVRQLRGIAEHVVPSISSADSTSAHSYSYSASATSRQHEPSPPKRQAPVPQVSSQPSVLQRMGSRTGESMAQPVDPEQQQQQQRQQQQQKQSNSRQPVPLAAASTASSSSSLVSTYGWRIPADAGGSPSSSRRGQSNSGSRFDQPEPPKTRDGDEEEEEDEVDELQLSLRRLQKQIAKFTPAPTPQASVPFSERVKQLFGDETSDFQALTSAEIRMKYGQDELVQSSYRAWLLNEALPPPQSSTPPASSSSSSTSSSAASQANRNSNAAQHSSSSPKSNAVPTTDVNPDSPSTTPNNDNAKENDNDAKEDRRRHLQSLIQKDKARRERASPRARAEKKAKAADPTSPSASASQPESDPQNQSQTESPSASPSPSSGTPQQQEPTVEPTAEPQQQQQQGEEEKETEASSSLSLPPGWRVYYAEGEPYYHNPTTGATQWDRPSQ